MVSNTQRTNIRHAILAALRAAGETGLTWRDLCIRVFAGTRASEIQTLIVVDDLTSENLIGQDGELTYYSL
jgi:hypothetical protein